MTTTKRKFVSISGLSDVRRIPRLGRIRLGHINHNTQTEKNYPMEDPFFHVPAEVAKVYGDQPTELDIMFPLNDRSIIFPQAYEYYGSARRLLCKGDGTEAIRWDTQKLSMVPTSCPCDLLGNGCKQRAHLQVLLPKVKSTGIYQIDTSSENSIIAINSYLDMLAPIDQPEHGILGYFAMVPLKLRRVPRDIYPNGMHRKTYPLELELDATEEEITSLREQKDNILATTRRWVVALPEELNPEDDRDANVTIDDAPAGASAAQAATGERPPETAASTPAVPVAQTTTETQAASPASEPGQMSSPVVSTPPAVTLPPAAMPAAANGAVKHPPASVTPLRGNMTEPQLNRILNRTRSVQIPDEIVRQLTASFTKTQASELITKVDSGDFSVFDRRNV
ncbi:MAG: hypothetical protein KGS09_17170 [Nitrospirae bacterium]|nr:hypothetical protein [Nitrospirota bacterium]MDE3039011.1 hypothetical protein [Nitrospirota bacterium]MDE3220982.1 hypothetical protein [Nitrospirota bacterium]